VKTTRKATAQVPLVTDLGDPLLAHWRFGLGKVTAFTSGGPGERGVRAQRLERGGGGAVGSRAAGAGVRADGGRVLGEGDAIVEDRPGRARWVELAAPMLLVVLLLGFVADLAVRRWENLLGCLEWGRERGER